MEGTRTVISDGLLNSMIFIEIREPRGGTRTPVREPVGESANKIEIREPRGGDENSPIAFRQYYNTSLRYKNPVEGTRT